jgi:hypothetical protein
VPFDPNTPTTPEQPGYPQQPQQPGYGQPQYPQPGYGYPQYQQPGYGQAPYPPGGGYPGGYPPTYAPGQPPQRRSNRGWIIGLSVGGGILLCIVLCVAGLYAGGQYLRTQGSNLYNSISATETAQSQQQATPTVNETVLYQNPMTGSPTGWASGNGCKPEADGYHISGGTLCLIPASAMSSVSDVDVTVTVQGVKTSTNTSYAVILRRASAGNFYSVEITPDGQWGIFKFVSDKGSVISDFQSSAAIQTGTGATNTLRVLLVGTHFLVSINGQQVGTADDSTYSSGRVGLGNDDSDQTSDIVFTNLTVAQPLS